MGEAAKPDDFFPPHLVQGYESFLQGDFRRERTSFHDLAEKGQHPHTLVIGCCDSRVTPEEIFDAAPGEIFDVRNIANLVPPFGETLSHHSAWAAVDYAVAVLRVSCIVVLGHGRCGGVRAFIEASAKNVGQPPSADDALSQWIGLIAPAARRLGFPPQRCGDEYAETLAGNPSGKVSPICAAIPGWRPLSRRAPCACTARFSTLATRGCSRLDEARGAFVQIAQERHTPRWLRHPRLKLLIRRSLFLALKPICADFGGEEAYICCNCFLQRRLSGRQGEPKRTVDGNSRPDGPD